MKRILLAMALGLGAPMLAIADETRLVALPLPLTSVTLWESPAGDLDCANAAGVHAIAKIEGTVPRPRGYDPCEDLIVGRVANGTEVAVVKKQGEAVMIRVLSGKLEGKRGWLLGEKLLSVKAD